MYHVLPPAPMPFLFHLRFICLVRVGILALEEYSVKRAKEKL